MYTVYVHKPDGINYKVNFNDCSGQERFQWLFKSCVRTTNALVFVFALNNKKSFLALDKWYQTAENFWKENNGIREQDGKFINPKTQIELPLFVIGNKSDLVDSNTNRESADIITDDMVTNWINSKPNKATHYYKISSKTLHNLPVYDILNTMQQIFQDRVNLNIVLNIMKQTNNLKLDKVQILPPTPDTNSDTNSDTNNSLFLEKCCK